MTVSNDQFDTLRRLIEQLAEAQFQGKTQHDREMVELRQQQSSIEAWTSQHEQEVAEIRQIQASSARAIEANSATIAANSATIAANSAAIAASKNQHDQEVAEIRQLQASNAKAIAASKNQHDQEMIELRQLQASNAKAIEALGSRVTEVAGQVAEVSSGVDAAFRTIESMNRVAESLETTQIEMRQQHHAQMDRLGNVLELLLTRYPMPPQAG